MGQAVLLVQQPGLHFLEEIEKWRSSLDVLRKRVPVLGRDEGEGAHF